MFFLLGFKKCRFLETLLIVSLVYNTNSLYPSFRISSLFRYPPFSPWLCALEGGTELSSAHGSILNHLSQSCWFSLLAIGFGRWCCSDQWDRKANWLGISWEGFPFLRDKHRMSWHLSLYIFISMCALHIKFSSCGQGDASFKGKCLH